MSGIFGDDEEGAAEKLKRAGGVGDRTIFTAPERRAGDGTGKTILAALPERRGEEIDPPPPRTWDQRMRGRFPEPHRQMPTYKLEELPPGLRQELERLIREREESEEDNKLQRDWERRLLFDPRPLRGPPGRFVPPLRPPSRFANGGGKGRMST